MIAATTGLRSIKRTSGGKSPAPAYAPLRIGVLGTGAIAQEFVAGLASSQLVDVVGIASREAARARNFSRRFDIPKVFSTYEALLADSEIEAVYLPLPNHLHAGWAITAAQSGKHILCEKPLATSLREAKKMFSAAGDAGVHLVEGLTYRSLPINEAMLKEIADGKIGDVKSISISIAAPIIAKGGYRLTASRGAGSLFDVGTYCLSLAQQITGEAPLCISAKMKWIESKVDISTFALLEYSGDIIVQFSCSFEAARHRQAIIVGTKGTIVTNFANHSTARARAFYDVRLDNDEGNRHSRRIEGDADGLRMEAESFASLVRTGSGWTGASEQESIKIAAALSAVSSAARRSRRAA